jgi:ketosteroid isomerase-like protein
MARNYGLFLQTDVTTEALMKRFVLWCVLTLVLLAATAWSQPQKNAEAEKVVADLEQQWLKSQRTNNSDLLVPLLADGFTATSSEGKVTNKAGTIADAKATKYTSVVYLDLNVAVFGETAVATGNVQGKGTDSGKPLDANERFTDTWVKMPKGKWQCVASHESPVKIN